MIKKLLIPVATLTILVSSVAYAETERGNKKSNHLVGSSEDTTFYAGRGNDVIDDTAPGDYDTVYAGRGNDTIFVNDSKRGNERDGDVVYCGRGYDTVYYDPNHDTVSSDCEDKVED